MKSKGIIITLTATLGATLIAMVVALVIFIGTTNTYSTQLENIYKRSFYELSENINDLEVDMSKLIAVNDVDSQRHVLTDIYNNCQLANTNISNLPITSNNTEKVNEFVNTVGGYAYSLLERVNGGEDFDEFDYQQIESLYDQTLVMSADYNNYIRGLEIDYKIIKDVNYDDGDKSSYDGGFTNSSSSSLPTLIYDGPFSDSVMNKEIKGLGTEVYTKEQAQQIIETQMEFLDITSVNYTSETVNEFETFNFDVTTVDSKLFVQVTNTGGKIIEITGYGVGGEDSLTDQEASLLAETFARNLGYENLYNVWSTKNGTIMYVNLAPIINGVIYYPDLVKVKVDTALGEVVALEAQNYCFNNVERTLSAPQISFDSAQSNLSPSLTVIERNLALVPNEFVGETLTYEFICTWRNYTYYVYVDVETGKEVNILRIIETNAGTLIM